MTLDVDDVSSRWQRSISSDKPSGFQRSRIEIKPGSSSISEAPAFALRHDCQAPSARRSVIRVNSEGRPSRSAKPGHSAVPLLT